MPTIRELFEQAQASQHVVDFGPFKLCVNTADGSGARYRDETRRDEFSDPLMRELIARLRPQMFLDLGANYGFTSLLHRTLNPDAAIVAVEMSPLLAPFVRKNFELNGCQRATVVEAAVGDAAGQITTRLNVFGSADNRVRPATADKFLSSDAATIPMGTVDQLLADLPATTSLMIKIDTQGYERHVFAGAAKTLARLERWAIKTEFGPSWLASQGTDAKRFLGELVEQFDVCELPQRPRFKGDVLDAIVASRLTAADVGPFVDWLASLVTNGRGWCDLLVMSRRRFR